MNVTYRGASRSRKYWDEEKQDCMTPEGYKICFPVDFSMRSALAAKHVKAWVGRFNAALKTVHVINRELHPEPYYELRRLVERREGDLRHFSNRYFGENVASCSVLVGDVADEIENFAERERVDLIMLPRDHQTLATRFVRDSLAATLLERCTASIWTTEHVDESQTVPANILCAVHLEPDASLEAENERLIQATRELVSRFQARVAVLHVIGKSGELDATETGTSEVEQWKRKVQEIFGNAITFLRKAGDVVTEIRETAEQCGADLIVVGRTTQPETLGIGRQTSDLKIDHATHRPILSVW
jgi:nucleotide-binding universal stress UspA family protein